MKRLSKENLFEKYRDHQADIFHCFPSTVVLRDSLVALIELLNVWKKCLEMHFILVLEEIHVI